MSSPYDTEVSLEFIAGESWMPYRRLLLISFIFSTVSTGFSQTVADVARAERARRQSLTKSVVPPNTPVKALDREALMNEALRNSGARLQVEQVIKASVPSAASVRLPEGLSAQDFQQIATNVFDVEHLMQTMEKSLAGKVDDKTLGDVVRWYRSPVGKKVTAAESNAKGADAAARLQRYTATLQSSAPSANRRQLIDAISAAGLGIPHPPADFAKTVVPEEIKSIGDGTTLWLLFAYNSLSESELSEYLTFLKSPSGAAFNNSVWNGIDTTFGDAAQQFGRKVAEKRQVRSVTASY
jgi:hypothetical protein